jgi:hypothetical protein
MLPKYFRIYIVALAAHDAVAIVEATVIGVEQAQF